MTHPLHPEKTLLIQYFALLREQRGCGEESIKTCAQTPMCLYQELSQSHGFTLSKDQLRVALNGSFKDWSTPLQDGDTVVFIPPVSGG